MGIHHQHTSGGSNSSPAKFRLSQLSKVVRQNLALHSIRLDDDGVANCIARGLQHQRHDSGAANTRDPFREESLTTVSKVNQMNTKGTWLVGVRRADMSLQCPIVVVHGGYI